MPGDEDAVGGTVTTHISTESPQGQTLAELYVSAGCVCVGDVYKELWLVTLVTRLPEARPPVVLLRLVSKVGVILVEMLSMDQVVKVSRTSKEAPYEVS